MKDEMARMAPLRRDEAKDFETLFEVTEAVIGFVPNSMLIWHAIPISWRHSPSFLRSSSYGRAGSIQA